MRSIPANAVSPASVSLACAILWARLPSMPFGVSQEVSEELGSYLAEAQEEERASLPVVCPCCEESAPAPRAFEPAGYVDGVPYVDVIESWYDDGAWYMPEGYREIRREYQDSEREYLKRYEQAVRVFLAPLPPPVECDTAPLAVKLAL